MVEDIHRFARLVLGACAWGGAIALAAGVILTALATILPKTVRH